MIISDCRAYLEKLKLEETDLLDVIDLDDDKAKSVFQVLERDIRISPNNDKTINYMISGFYKVREQVLSLKVRKLIYQFIEQLIFQLHKLTSMNYADGVSGGLVHYTSSLYGTEDVRPNAIYYFGK